MYKGVYTALVTPFDDRGIDLPALERLIDSQIDAGITGIVPCGTTGETPTLSDAERDTVVTTAVQRAAGRCEVVAGTGSNSTAHTIAYTQRAKALGATTALVVVPYYNKPTQEGLYQHFRAVAEQGGLPVMLYNVPGRTGVDMLADTVVRLSEVPGIVAMKEACGSTDRVAELRARCRAEFSILSGDDVMTLPMMAVGASGVVSVASNVEPGRVVKMVRAALDNDYASARVQHLALRALFNALFVESNPTPAKAALAQKGMMQDIVRLPLIPASEQTRKVLREVLAHLG